MAIIRPPTYWKHVRPLSAIADLREVYRQAGKNRWWVAIAAASVTGGIFSVIAQEGGIGPPIRPTVTLITSWPADRSLAEIKASNIVNQARKDRLAAEQAVRDEKVRNIYKTIGRASGMDFAAIERKAAEDRAAEEAAAKAAAPKVTILPSNE